jgi:hypothetical protein
LKFISIISGRYYTTKYANLRKAVQNKRKSAVLKERYGFFGSFLELRTDEKVTEDAKAEDYYGCQVFDAPVTEIESEAEMLVCASFEDKKKVMQYIGVKRCSAQQIPDLS